MVWTAKLARYFWIAAAILVFLSACSETPVTQDTPSTSTTESPPTTARTGDDSTSTTTSERPLDISRARWIAHDVFGVRLDDGTPIWETKPFPAGVARDRQGGIVFSDSEGLWWYRAGATEPERVTGGSDDVIAVAATDDGPVAVMRGSGPDFISLSDGKPVEAPPDLPVAVSAESTRTVWTADNGLSAWVTQPDVDVDSDGRPSETFDPAFLFVSRGDEVLVEIQIGGPYEEWATIHDFDGRTLVLARGPLEPAMPEETFMVLDLAAGTVTDWFTASGTRLTLTGADVVWEGPVVVPDLGFLSPSPIATDEGVRELTDDARYLVWISGAEADGSKLEVDIAVWLTGNAANTAARIAGETDVPVPNDYYIFDVDPTILSIPVDADVAVTSVWFDYDTEPDLANDPISYQEFLDVITGDDEGVRGNMRSDPWWITVRNGRIVALDEQYIP